MKVVLCLNLGSPEAPEVRPIRRYLASFLDDRRVISLPLLLRKILLWLVILPFRPYKVKEAYRAIWMKSGSPLVHYSDAFVKTLQVALGEEYKVILGMRHGNPNWEAALKTALSYRPESLILFAQYPQYASATTGSQFEAIFKYLSKEEALPNLHFISDFYNHPAYLDALAKSIQPYLTPQSTLLLSYHGLPVRDIDKVEDQEVRCNREKPCPKINKHNRHCYRAQCYETSRGVEARLGINAVTSFQSRLGRIPWIQPYTDVQIAQLREQGVTELVVACPAFTTDCLETLEEIGIALKAQWQSLGGEKFTLVPCLNDQEIWVSAAASMITQI